MHEDGGFDRKGNTFGGLPVLSHSMVMWTNDQAIDRIVYNYAIYYIFSFSRVFNKWFDLFYDLIILTWICLFEEEQAAFF